MRADMIIIRCDNPTCSRSVTRFPDHTRNGGREFSLPKYWQEVELTSGPTLHFCCPMCRQRGLKAASQDKNRSPSGRDEIRSVIKSDETLKRIGNAINADDSGLTNDKAD